MMPSFTTFSLRPLAHTLLYVVFVFFFCEYVIYYLALFQCTWPQLEPDAPGAKPLKMALIADTHLLGPKTGHWFDKLRREWQMYRSFQSMLMIHSPSAVFFLGDIFDEGLWSSEREFRNYVDRFRSLFSASKDTSVYVIAGNHDIGFHYSITPYLNQRFVKTFDAPAVKVLTLEGNILVLVNSMAMEGDNCSLCLPAVNRLNRISTAIKCANGPASACNGLPKLPVNTRPILLQHFPMYRESDEACEGPDASPDDEKLDLFRQKVDCLSQSASDQLLSLLNPRLIFGGHTHHGCLIVHPPNTPEWSVPSFSWRNRDNPSFFLVTVTPQKHGVKKCFLPQESTVIYVYFLSVVLLVAWAVSARVRVARLWPTSSKNH